MTETSVRPEARENISGVVGYFPNADALHVGMEQIKKAHTQPPVAYLPIPDIPAVEVFNPSSSGVRWFSLVGGLSGIATALAMTIWMSWDYPLVVGGKPITSLPPFLVVAFELMILFGSIASIIGFLWMARLPDLTPSEAYRPPMGVDHYAIYIPCRDAREQDYAEKQLREAGAFEVTPVYHTERRRLQVLR